MQNQGKHLLPLMDILHIILDLVYPLLMQVHQLLHHLILQFHHHLILQFLHHLILLLLYHLILQLLDPSLLQFNLAIQFPNLLPCLLWQSHYFQWANQAGPRLAIEARLRLE